ncbi:hypothetical protein AM493_15470 [Flavobacterium akiainvivens]|uniref:DUF4270 domain-containing protein n=1 Tax=Flavobacterium akiainvivens TaxID=1202724 RepID=A0A0N0RQY0_9FLAO|nr:DUF4270 domain-containing protein [Flavobacterium akiainvivens]KOS07280.1 hypothetical protein AM493_15470 [Flavobacterium akiainvivens]SFQ46129.1 protein of unknown function [Flavobacterium akiainvivens]
MNNFSLFTRFLIALSFVGLVSCDDDYNEVGSDIIGGDEHSSIIRKQGSLVAYDRATGAVQANNLDVNVLGVYDNPVFGKTIAHYVTQLNLDSPNPTITSNPQLDSVWLYIPYYNTLTETDSDGHSKYTLDSIYGDTVHKFRLRLKKNNYYLRDADAGSGGADGQKYYNTDKAMIDNQATGNLLADVPYVDFRYSAAQIRRTATYTNDEGEVQTNAEVELMAPGIFLYLDRAFFQQNILDQGGTGNLVNNNVFHNFLRGIYFEVEQIGSQSVMGVPNWSEGEIKLIYSQDDLDSDGELQYEDDGTTILREDKELTISLGGNSINLLETTTTQPYATALATTNLDEGDEKLYIKGGQGSMAFIDILSPADIAQLQSENALINEANLVFYVDRSAMAATGTTGRQAVEPLRVYLYDVNNKRPLYDYSTDITTNTLLGNKYAKYIHGGIAQKGADGRTVQYKIRLTNHINNIITKDSTNVKLALVVTENIGETGNAALQTGFTEQVKYARTDPSGIVDPTSTNVSRLPVGSVTHPFGIILYGTNPAVPEEKRARLEIFYTKPD